MRTAFFFLLTLLATATLAQAQQTLAPMIDAERKCGVFIPPQLAKTYPAMQWNGGACANGLAIGEGFVTFHFAPDKRPVKVWQGNFRDGFFIGEAKAFQIKPLGDRGALVFLPAKTYREGFPWLLTRLLADGPLPLCGRAIGEIAIEAAPELKKFDEALLRRMMQNAATAYRLACPQPIKLHFAVVEAGKLGVLADGSFAGANDVVARGSLAEGAPIEAINDFYNVAFNPSVEESRKREMAASRTTWTAFTRSNWVVYWVKPRQLALTPWRYERKVVAFAARYVRMVAPNTALLRDDDGGEVLVRDLPDAVLQSAARGEMMVLAGTGAGVVPLALSRYEVSTVVATDWKLCQRARCADFLEWIDEEKKPFPWGEDQSQF
jgi:hypothetical protein